VNSALVDAAVDAVAEEDAVVAAGNIWATATVNVADGNRDERAVADEVAEAREETRWSHTPNSMGSTSATSGPPSMRSNGISCSGTGEHMSHAYDRKPMVAKRNKTGRSVKCRYRFMS